MANSRNWRRTKIVCTVGPAIATPERIRAMITAGMQVARLNFSHGDHESHQKMIDIIRREALAQEKQIAILQDLAGPKIRLGVLPDEKRMLEADEEVELVPDGETGPGQLPVNYPYLLEDVDEGERIMLSDGLVELVVAKKNADRLICRVLVPGEISSRKGVNLPTSPLRISAFTDKDAVDLAMGIKAGVDMVALSFVRHEKDLDPILRMIADESRPPLVIAKIEKPQALERLEEILKVVDGVMVARGDLGVEMPLEQVPMIQKRVITEARRAGRVVITATQMLRSMMQSPRPTRAEATDVANAVLDGTDAVMLSDETAVGEYPIEAVRVLDRICRATEPFIDHARLLREELSDLLPPTEAAISRAACYLARDLKAAAIVAATASGGTARLLARFRPATPIVGLTPDPRTARQLAITWGVIPGLTGVFSDSASMTRQANVVLKHRKLADPGDVLVVTAGYPIGVPGSTNMIKVLEME